MSDSRRGKAGRLGDETRARINDLKGGWELPGDSEGAPEPGESRQDRSDEAMVAPAVARAKRSSKPSRPPPLPRAARSKGPTKPPPLPKAREGSPSQPPPIRKPASTAAPSLPAPAVVGLEGALDDRPTAITNHDAPDALSAASVVTAGGGASGTVRLPDSIPRRSGVVGDIAYLFRVIAKRRSSKIEMAELADKITSLKESRNVQLLEVARHAIGDDRNDQTLVGRARVSLLEIEERRSLHAGRVAAADEKMAALSRHRGDKLKHRITEEERLSKEVDSINASLEPLQTRASNARKRAGDLRKHLQVIDEKIRREEASLVSVEGPADKAAVHASIASLRAERDTVAADEPLMAAEIDDLEPKISSLISTRSALADKIVALDQERELDEVRVKEKEVAVEASRTVENRAVGDQASKRQDALLELGEALHNKPAEATTPRTDAIEKQDLEIGTLERRRLELRELRSSVETFPMVMGAMWLLLFFASIAAAVIFVTTR